MTNEEYIRSAMRTEAPITGDTVHRACDNLRLLHGAIGLCTESGELIDDLKKHIFYGKELDVTNIFIELGDLLWYFAEVCDVLNFKIEDIMDANDKKLRVRFPQCFTGEQAINRNPQLERIIVAEGQLREWAEGSTKEPVIDLSNPDKVSNTPAELPITDWIGPKPTGIDLTKPVPPIVHKEIPYEPTRDSVPEPQQKQSAYAWLVERFGWLQVDRKTREFLQDFHEAMARSANDEDIQLFYHQWRKKEIRKTERPEIRVK